jgi:hypothetical protein
MLWKHYVFTRGTDVQDMWDVLFEKREVRLLYIGGRGFDTRAQTVMAAFVQNLKVAAARIAHAELLLVGFTGFHLSDELQEQTKTNTAALKAIFNAIGQSRAVSITASARGEDDLTASNALRIGTEEVLAAVGDHTDIVLDISTLPRVAYLALLTGLLHKLVPNKDVGGLWANGVNLQVLVAEDADLDSQIRSEDPSNELVLIPGFSSALYAESVQDWPLVWFPILGENRVNQLEKVLSAAIPPLAEICFVLPHPSKAPRRSDLLLVEYKRPLFDSRQTPISNILYAHEANPFEAYRQLRDAMERYKASLSILGGCRLVVTPLSSKLMTLGAGLACFEMNPNDLDAKYGVAIPYAGPTRYGAEIAAFRTAQPELAAILLTGDAYR